jgi:glycosyltransferase involved in cell wall biosynthesis
MKTLRQFYSEHEGKVSDKWNLYLDEYDRIFEPYRDKPVRLLEIGIQNGGSLEIWSKYFAKADALVGCDINEKCSALEYEDKRISLIINNANSDEAEEAILAESTQYDVIIDDGSHTSEDIVHSFSRYFPHLAENGVFIAEDLHCSYWQEFGGGLFDPYSSVSFFKHLADLVNFEHWGVRKDRSDLLNIFSEKFHIRIAEDQLASIHSVEFINSMCVIKKRTSDANILGKRHIVGSEATVVEGQKEIAGSFINGSNQSGNSYSNNALHPALELEFLRRDLLQMRRSLEASEKQVANVQEASERQLEASQNQLERSKKQLEASEEQVANVQEASERQLEASQNQLEGFEKQLEASEKQVAKVQEASVIIENNIAVLESELDKSNRTINELTHSTSWKMTALLRLAGTAIIQLKNLAGRSVMPLRLAGRAIRKPAQLIRMFFAAISLSGGFKPAVRKALNLWRQDGFQGLLRGYNYVATRSSATGVFEGSDYQKWINEFDSLNESSRSDIEKDIRTLASRPLLSIVIPVYNANIAWLDEAIESVRGQLYDNWQLCIADDHSTDPKVVRYLKKKKSQDSRIDVVFRENNGHISAASNSALSIASGAWVVLLDQDDLLSEQALYWIVKTINDNPDGKLFYSDEDKINEEGKRHNPYFKCDWNRSLFYSQNLISHLGVYDRTVVKDIGGFRVGFEGSQDHDLALRFIECINDSAIVHIPRVLYHWRVHANSTAGGADAKPYAVIAGEKAIREHLERLDVQGEVTSSNMGYRVKYALPDVVPMVSLVIPTRNGLDLVRTCIESIVKKTSYPNYEIILVDNGSDDPDCLEYFSKIEEQYSYLSVKQDDRPFNYSALNNAAVAEAKGEIVGLINNDIEVINPGWLSEMVSIVLQPNVGAVGAKLLYSDDTVQHAGVLMGLGGVAGHAHLRYRKDDPGYYGRLNVVNEFSAVTAACLLVKKSDYQKVGGLNEINLTVAFNDVDFCLKLKDIGLRNVWSPYALLYHHESATRGHEDSPEKIERFNTEVAYMMKTWGKYIDYDPCYSPNLSLNISDFSLAWPPRIKGLC